MQQFLGSFFQKVMKAWSWVSLISLAVLIKVISFFPDIVERYYTYGVYPVISKVQRIVFGWLPISIGDLLYASIVLIILVKGFQLGMAIFQKKISRQFLLAAFKQFVFILMFVYVFFYALWGLNYNRLGISSQLQLQVSQYTVQDLDTLTGILQQRLNVYARQVDSVRRASLHNKRKLFNKSFDAYNEIDKQYPFLNYSHVSIKPSLYTYLGQFFGFTGYYNPFSGEAQVRTNVPVFIQPYIATHEIAHQLGYAKENEANFVAFLVCRSYNDPDFKYSLYYDLYNYSVSELFRYNVQLGKQYQQKLDTQVKKDARELWKFYSRTRNFVEPFISKMYDEYLRMNNQPKGKRTYNEVVAWLIAYYKKFGKEAL